MPNRNRHGGTGFAKLAWGDQRTNRRATPFVPQFRLVRCVSPGQNTHLPCFPQNADVGHNQKVQEPKRPVAKYSSPHTVQPGFVSQPEKSLTTKNAKNTKTQKRKKQNGFVAVSCAARALLAQIGEFRKLARARLNPDSWSYGGRRACRSP